MSSEWTSVSIEEIAGDWKGSMAVGPFGSRMKADLYVPSGVRVIRGNNLSGGREPEGDYVYVTEQTADSLASCCLKPGDLVFPHRGNIGEVGITPDDGQRYMLSTSLMKLSPDRTKAEPLYLMYFFKSAIGRAALLMNASQVGTPGIATPLKSLRGIQLPLPSLLVQRQIVETLSKLDDRITLLRETNATLEAIAQSLFKSWFVDFDPVRAKNDGRVPDGMDEATAALFPDAFCLTDIGEIPATWSVQNVGTIANVIDCLHTKKPELLSKGMPYLQLNNIRDDGLLDTSTLAKISETDYAKWTSRIEVREGDCVITNVGRVGAVAQIPAGFTAAMGRNMTALRLRSGWQFPTYLIELLQSQWMRIEIQSKTDFGTILDALNVKSIPNLRCVCAAAEVMNAFETAVRPIRAKMEANIALMSSLTGVRNNLLPRLISGKLRLPETLEEATQ